MRDTQRALVLDKDWKDKSMSFERIDTYSRIFHAMWRTISDDELINRAGQFFRDIKLGTSVKFDSIPTYSGENTFQTAGRIAFDFDDLYNFKVKNDMGGLPGALGRAMLDICTDNFGVIRLARRIPSDFARKYVVSTDKSDEFDDFSYVIRDSYELAVDERQGIDEQTFETIFRICPICGYEEGSLPEAGPSRVVRPEPSGSESSNINWIDTGIDDYVDNSGAAGGRGTGGDGDGVAAGGGDGGAAGGGVAAGGGGGGRDTDSEEADLPLDVTHVSGETAAVEKQRVHGVPSPSTASHDSGPSMTDSSAEDGHGESLSAGMDMPSDRGRGSVGHETLFSQRDNGGGGMGAVGDGDGDTAGGGDDNPPSDEFSSFDPSGDQVSSDTASSRSDSILFGSSDSQSEAGTNKDGDVKTNRQSLLLKNITRHSNEISEHTKRVEALVHLVDADKARTKREIELRDVRITELRGIMQNLNAFVENEVDQVTRLEVEVQKLRDAIAKRIAEQNGMEQKSCESNN
jgi:hypothetical protein